MAIGGKACHGRSQLSQPISGCAPYTLRSTRLSNPGFSDERRQQKRPATSAPPQRSNFLEGLARSLGNKPSDEFVEQVIATQLAINCPRSCVIQTLEQTDEKKIPRDR
jgi:hypothetical protein